MQPRTWMWWSVGLACALCLGAACRFVWVEDMEYKGDECWNFIQTQEARRTHDSRWLGMVSSSGVTNPGMSLWVFEFAAAAFGITEPTGLARAVQASSVLAVLLLVAFAVVSVPAPEREAWLWATALVSLSPIAILFHRKIWAPSMFPIFISVLLIGWWYRRHRLGAFVWGLVGALLGQIQGSGFFFAAGFVAWAFLWDRKRVAWLGWFIGSILGSSTLLPWLYYLATTPHQVKHKTWVHICELKFWYRWVTESLGWGMTYPFREDVVNFMSYPHVAGQPTYFVAFLHALIVIAGLILFVRALRDWREQAQAGPSLIDRLTGRHSPTAFTVSAALWGFGLLMTFSCLPIHRHYMIVLFPLEFLWLARIALGATSANVPVAPERLRFGRTFLGALCALQLVLTITFLTYVHHHQGTQGDYGPSYTSTQNKFPSMWSFVDPLRITVDAE